MTEPPEDPLEMKKKKKQLKKLKKAKKKAAASGWIAELDSFQFVYLL